MRSFYAFLLLGTLPLFGASPEISPSRVTVLVEFDKAEGGVSLPEVQRGLQTILQPVGYSVDLRFKRDVQPFEEFGPLVIFTLKGRCSMDPWPTSTFSEEHGPLALAFSSDGIVLPFGEVECDRVRYSIERAVGRGNSHAYRSIYARAIGMVMAHEMYHMLANSTKHTKGGVTKESLSPRELLDGNLGLPSPVQEAIRSSIH